MADKLPLPEQLAALRQVVEMLDHMSTDDRVDVLMSVASQAMDEVLLLADEVLQPEQAQLLRGRFKEETGG